MQTIPGSDRMTQTPPSKGNAKEKLVKLNEAIKKVLENRNKHKNNEKNVNQTIRDTKRLFLRISRQCYVVKYSSHKGEPNNRRNPQTNNTWQENVLPGVPQ